MTPSEPDLTAGPSPDLLALSRRYGSDPAFVLAGGGNTSSKTPGPSGAMLWVKASGHALATIDASGFVALDRAKLDAVLHANWPSDTQEREALFQKRIAEARLQPERGQRPSVEALLHHLLPATLVVHTHPGAVNALTCCVDGERLTRELFGDDVLWQAYVDPGLVLAQTLERSLAGHARRTGGAPAVIFLQNHGLIVAGANAGEIETVTSRLLSRIADVFDPPSSPSGDNARLSAVVDALAALRPGACLDVDSSAASRWLAGTNAGRAAALSGPLTPDQIVYCRSAPLWLNGPHDLAAAWANYQATLGVEPWVVVVEGAGVITVRASPALAATTRAVFADAAAVYRDAHRLGGVAPLSPRHRQFIEEWEVEAYRRAVAAGDDVKGRIIRYAGKVRTRCWLERNIASVDPDSPTSATV